MARASKRTEREHDSSLEPSKRVRSSMKLLTNPGNWSLPISPQVHKGSQYIQDVNSYGDEEDVVIHTDASPQEALDAMKTLEQLVEFCDLETTFLDTASESILEQMNALSKEMPKDLRANDVFCLLNPMLGMERSLSMFRSKESFAAMCLGHRQEGWVVYAIKSLDCDVIKRLYEKNWLDFQETIRQNVPKLFQLASSFDRLDVMQWLWSLNSSIDIDEIFRDACELGYLEISQWLWSLGKDMNLCEHEGTWYKCSIFQLVCKNGHLDVAQWLWSLGSSINIHADNEYAFREACGHGHLDVAQWLWGLDGKIDIHIEKESAFREACWGGHLGVAQWLWSLDESINIHAEREDAFRGACVNDHLDIAKWLWSLDESIDLHVDDDVVFKETFQKGNLGVAKWLWSLDSFHLYALMYDLFNDVCGCNCIDMIQWFGSLDSSLVKQTCKEKAFQEACANGHLEVAQWLWSLDDTIDIEDQKEQLIRDARTNGHEKVVQWLETMFGEIKHVSSDTE